MLRPEYARRMRYQIWSLSKRVGETSKVIIDSIHGGRTKNKSFIKEDLMHQTEINLSILNSCNNMVIEKWLGKQYNILVRLSHSTIKQAICGRVRI